MREDEMVGWHHQFKGHEFEYALGVGDGQGGLARCSPRPHGLGVTVVLGVPKSRTRLSNGTELKES